MKKKSPLLIIFLTVMIDLIGFGLVLPILPMYGKNFGASGPMIGIIMASYSLMQFIFAPIWGRISDRIGRRPVLLASTAFAAVSYVMFAIGSGLENKTVAIWVILLSRVLAGVCGANITVAQAYIADISPPELRSARMGLIGMAFGLGFILGPPLGGESSYIFNSLSAPGWVAASLCALNFISAFMLLPESWKPSAEHLSQQRPHVEQWLHTLGTPKIGLLIGIFFLATFCFSSFETTIGLLLMHNYHIDTSVGAGLRKVGWLVAYCGFVGALIQGGGTKRFVKKYGEPKVIAASLILAGVGVMALPYLTSWGSLLIWLAIFSIGSSLTRPPVFGMISMLTSSHEQGTNLGVAQGVGSLARIVGPLFALSLFDLHPAVPYLICGALCLITGAATARYLSHVHPATAAGGEPATPPA